jgi:metal-responsive CopG/Arc/MetJ family transcriptional regulator
MYARGVAKVQKTIRLPKSLLDEVERMIKYCRRGESTNDFIVKSVHLRISMLKRKELDAKFSEMSKDTDYQRDAQLMAEEFENSDWETAKLLDE